MKCPSCQAANPDGQKFCGGCGHTLETTCARCGAGNPLHYKFCGQCGEIFGKGGAIALARSGLITRIDPAALNLLGYELGEMQGKPFSLFVHRPDLVVFFSHWNELFGKGEAQSFEISLKHKEQQRIFVRLECSVAPHPAKAIDAIHLSLTEITDKRLAAAEMQTQQELLGLTLTITNNINTVGRPHLAQAMEAALKKICLFTKADVCRIHGFNRALNRLEALYEWWHPSVPPPEADGGTKHIALAKVKHVLIRLRREKTVVVNDTAQLTQPERDEWLAWHPNAPGAAICHLIYSGAAPVGVIAVAKAGKDDKWAPNCVGLVKFLGDLVADRMSVDKSPPGRRSRAGGPGDSVDGGGKQAPAERPEGKRKGASAYMTRPMLLEKSTGGPAEDQRPVFPRDDGLVLLTCPACALQEPVSLERFEKLGKAIAVNCSCGKQFAAVLEKRRYFRKSVLLQGYFSLGGDPDPIGASGTLWGTMMVKDLSKAGLRFTTEKAGLLRPGDRLMVRFNLDNTSQALIHKPVKVIAVTNHGVGCLFEGADSYDITLGFYLM